MTKEDLEVIIYTSSEKDLLNFFKNKFKFGHPLSEYKAFNSLIYDLDIECIEYAITRLKQIDDGTDYSRFSGVVIPLVGLFFTVYFKTSVLISSLFLGAMVIGVLFIVSRGMTKRNNALFILRIFDFVKSRKNKK
ncbi:hypothetical protein PJ311_18170 [Bacillus sp. CLL-7-23]|uniref:Uncharacterized protein n=1 Tax=Bacillus changyiensis TaxID=3004103 RepID=A0ABT4X8U3_9BACI|nr:hypothetical protein [Bacillus changyiensis]MDA7028467.1 hypothetical protein [Bacillus changyiensis]